tara:strand:+ start:122835 stop:123482 length:648 start_codon:yes stop_codon:yes gene_type:complete
MYKKLNTYTDYFKEELKVIYDFYSSKEYQNIISVNVNRFQFKENKCYPEMNNHFHVLKNKMKSNGFKMDFDNIFYKEKICGDLKISIFFNINESEYRENEHSALNIVFSVLGTDINFSFKEVEQVFSIDSMEYEKSENPIYNKLSENNCFFISKITKNSHQIILNNNKINGYITIYEDNTFEYKDFKNKFIKYKGDLKDDFFQEIIEISELHKAT